MTGFRVEEKMECSFAGSMLPEFNGRRGVQWNFTATARSAVAPRRPRARRAETHHARRRWISGCRSKKNCRGPM